MRWRKAQSSCLAPGADDRWRRARLTAVPCCLFNSSSDKSDYGSRAVLVGLLVLRQSFAEESCRSLGTASHW